MRTVYRIASTAVAVAAIFPFGTLPAHAATADVKVETASWFWASQTANAVPNAPALPPEANGVPKGNLPVAFKGETEKDAAGDTVAKPDKETYLAWDIYFLPEGSTVDKFTFTLFLNPDAEQLFTPAFTPPTQSSKGGQPALIACLPTAGFGEGEAESYAIKPADDCTNRVFGEFDDKTQSYTFDATTFAQDWVDGTADNFGLGIRPDEDPNQAPFQLVFKGAADVKATITYTPAVEDEEEPPVVDPFVPLPPAPPIDNSGYAPVPQVQPQPQPQPQPAPVVVQTRAPVSVNNVASSPLTTSRGLSPVFWFAMIGGVLLIGVTSMILGDPLEATVASRGVRTGGRHRLNTPAPAPARRTGTVRPRIV